MHGSPSLFRYAASRMVERSVPGTSEMMSFASRGGESLEQDQERSVKTEIETRFAANMDRVQHLVEVYQSAATGGGTPSGGDD